MILAESGIDPQVIIVFVAMILAGIKALVEKIQAGKKGPPPEATEEDYEAYDEYEALLEQQRQELGLPSVRKTTPPPLTPMVEEIFTPPPLPKVTKPTLSAAEKSALANLKLDSPRHRKPTISTKGRLKQHLSSPTAAREALLLSEIFGKPKSLK